MAESPSVDSQRSTVENWPAWVVVNVVSVGLFAYKGLWLTVLLYAVFALMAVAGWRAVPVSRAQSLKFGYARGTTTRVGSKLDTISVAWQFLWFDRPKAARAGSP